MAASPPALANFAVVLRTAVARGYGDARPRLHPIFKIVQVLDQPQGDFGPVGRVGRIENAMDPFERLGVVMAAGITEGPLENGAVFPACEADMPVAAVKKTGSQRGFRTRRSSCQQQPANNRHDRYPPHGAKGLSH